MGWVVEHGVTGLKVPPAQADALADAFRQLDGDRVAMQAMGMRGRKKFEQFFEINRSAEGVLEIYEDVLSHPVKAADGANP